MKCTHGLQYFHTLFPTVQDDCASNEFAASRIVFAATLPAACAEARAISEALAIAAFPNCEFIAEEKRELMSPPRTDD